MDIVDIIKKQHQDIRALIQQTCGKEEYDTEERKQIIQLILTKLRVHAMIEEMILFPRMEERATARSAALEAWEYHTVATNIAKGLVQLSPADELWIPRWRVVKGVILIHIDAEENRVLSSLQKAFTQEEREDMGRKFIRAENAAIEKNK